MSNSVSQIQITVVDGQFVQDDIALSNEVKIPYSGPHFHSVLKQHGLNLRHSTPNELQINLGKLCNLACHHCHVDAGPKRTEIMSWEVMQRILQWADTAAIKKADLTGGAPELNPDFRKFCDALIDLGIEITSRCNITVLFEPNQSDLAQWYADRQIRLVCSLPCYTEDNVDAQRGKGVFDKSIAGLQQLNAVGYGVDPNLRLDLVYNPGGAFLPPPQDSLEADYRRMLRDKFSIEFSNLLAITNIPINRFAHALLRDQQLEPYQHLLVENFNPETVEQLMCRSLINLDWYGRIYDCDFNQMLELPMGGGKPRYLWELDVNEVAGSSIATNRHCFGCTAGAGSSCGGVLAD
ncbi:radical SAM/Cys-rich domain protein [Arenicella chitinivorans]|uniref:Radical SAM/Cys-rich domain protein n=1 Tax=Arenicella chitinivorans TaxID=1329800 RepID=A0A918RQP6_9GAMM|nr:arsenosugar biosynthesis radical SAM (seleno)protein ArsS [Arenicella chitinivorans]GHA08527.1 radical SAM/Cys-rich domain protein [Arenicella chitinivorans]